MTFVGITQRVAEMQPHQERRDCLDQRWIAFLQECEFTLVPLPNDLKTAQSIVTEINMAGFILSGGDNIQQPETEREKVERYLLDYSISEKIPVIGVCRGMQFMHVYAGGALEHVEKHVRENHVLDLNGTKQQVNSYHEYGFREPAAGFEVLARAEDGVIEAFTNKKNLWFGQMWHPERENPFYAHDIETFKRAFS